jgi:hypothetical protein
MMTMLYFVVFAFVRKKKSVYGTQSILVFCAAEFTNYEGSLDMAFDTLEKTDLSSQVLF